MAHSWVLAIALIAAPKSLSETLSNTIVLGQSASFSCETCDHRREFRKGAKLAFTEANNQGGIHGKNIQLISKEDNYNPSTSVQNTQSFLSNKNMFCLFGYGGTASLENVLPIAKQQQIPLFAPLTGSNSAYTNKEKTIFTIKASYKQQSQQIIDYLVRYKKSAIAIINETNAFGLNAREGAIQLLSQRGIKPVHLASIQRGATDTEPIIKRMIMSEPDAILVFASRRSSPTIIQTIRNFNEEAQVFLHSNAMAEKLPRHLRHGIGVAQTVPFPWDSSKKIVRDYQRLMRRHAHDYGFSSLEGYIAARTFLKALEETGPNPSRQKFMQTLETMGTIDLDGYTINFTPTNHNGSSFTELTFLVGDYGAFIH